MLLSSGWCLANSNGLLGISTQVSLVSFIDTRLTCVSGTLVWAIIMWFKHPRYLRAKENFISSFFPSNLNSFNYILPKVLFICGGDEAFCSNRGLLEKYITKHHKEFITFRAELAWEVISNLGTHRNVNALSLGRVRISTLRNENETFSQLNSITYIGVFLRLVTYSHLP